MSISTGLLTVLLFLITGFIGAILYSIVRNYLKGR